jgi:hypothetical protein
MRMHCERSKETAGGSDIKAMSLPGVRLIGTALDGDKRSWCRGCSRRRG